ncbi:MAG: FtsQ-type POTRA domain-containing protein, partial [Thermodesulfobacteriota bacterium]|nr:FtsQ-type POTRA domain-containing protein [Thermodesulfobacteriota bacterium]
TIVRGCNKVSKERILELAGISSSMNILAVNLKKMALGIENNPWVRTVTIGREFPDRLVIDVVERNAVALLKNDKEMYVVDSDGEVFKKFEAGDIVDVPVFTGCYRNGSVNETLMEQAFEFLDCLSEGDNFPREWNVSEIYSDDVYAFSVFTDNHLFLNLGFGDYETKLKRLNRILTDLKQRGLDKTFLSIDLVDCSRIAVEHRNVFSPKNLTGDRKIEI